MCQTLPAQQPETRIPDRRVADIVDSLQRLDGPVRLSDLASTVCLSGERLRHLFREQMGCGIRAYLKQQRLARAKDMLTTTQLSIKEICAALSLDPSRFCRDFKQAYGATPTGYRCR